MKKSSSRVGVAILLVAVVIISLTWWKTGRDARSTAAPPPVSASEPLSADAEAMARMRRSTGPISAPMSPQAMQAQREADRKESRTIVDAGKKKLFAQFQAERIDANWAVPKEQAIQALRTAPYIEEVNAVPTSFDVQCRSSTCRITADFPSRLAATDWANLFPMSVGTEMPNLSLEQTTNADGTVRIEIYGLARP